jgi:carotenoid cleavage dioxygenase
MDLVRSFALDPEQLSERDLGNNLMKYDFQTGEKQTHHFKGRSLSEPTFVEACNPQAEDDGYLLLYEYDPERGASDLCILSARDVSAEPLARVHLPARVPLGLHCNWAPDIDSVRAFT